MRKRRTARASTMAALGVALAALASCKSGPDVQPGLAVSQPVTELGQDGFGMDLSASYQLRPSDTISVRVFREESLSLAEVPISAEGEISLPLAGTVQAAGLTPRQLETRIEELLSARYLRDPDVAVNVVEYRSHQVTVEGSVRTPGLYAFRPGTRLSGAISLAEGPVREAQLRDVAVFRQAPGGMQIAKFDYNAVRAGQMIDPVLQPGDRIVVGTNGLTQFWQDLLRALPAFGIFTNL